MRRAVPRLSVEVEIPWLYPCLDAVAADAYGYVALQYDVARACVFVGSAHLGVQVVLHEIPERHLAVALGCRVGHRQAFALVEAAVVGPRPERGRAIHVAVVAEGGVRHEPLLVGLEELCKRAPLHHCLALFGIEFAQIGQLGVVHPFVVNLRQGVELGAQLLIVLAPCLVGERRQLPQVGVLRVQGIDAYAVVRV